MEGWSSVSASSGTGRPACRTNLIGTVCGPSAETVKNSPATVVCGQGCDPEERDCSAAARSTMLNGRAASQPSALEVLAPLWGELAKSRSTRRYRPGLHPCANLKCLHKSQSGLSGFQHRDEPVT